MAATRIYRCTRCRKGPNEGLKREQLTVKKVVFSQMGSGARVIRSRVSEWLCPDCIGQDKDWNREPFANEGIVIADASTR